MGRQVCNEPGCPELTDRRKCVRHRSEYEQERGSSTARGYDAEWERLVAFVLERAGYRCHWCGGYATTGDHVVPKKRGGPSVPSNVVAACGWCNSSKRDRDAPGGHHR